MDRIADSKGFVAMGEAPNLPRALPPRTRRVVWRECGLEIACGMLLSEEFSIDVIDFAPGTIERWARKQELGESDETLSLLDMRKRCLCRTRMRRPRDVGNARFESDESKRFGWRFGQSAFGGRCLSRRIDQRSHRSGRLSQVSGDPCSRGLSGFRISCNRDSSPAHVSTAELAASAVGRGWSNHDVYEKDPSCAGLGRIERSHSRGFELTKKRQERVGLGANTVVVGLIDPADNALCIEHDDGREYGVGFVPEHAHSHRKTVFHFDS